MECAERLIISDSFGELKTRSEKLLGVSQVVGFKLFKILGNKLLAKGMASTYKADYAILAKEYFYNACMDVDLNQMVIARRAINKIDTLEKLKNVNAPSIVIVGGDFGESFIRINKKIAMSLGTDLVIIENSMDPSNLVNPHEFNNIILNFLCQTKVELDDNDL